MLDAALEAGFGSYPQFHRIFKRVMGRSPGKYRRQN
jgi:AraC-like DNA-binding protein